jgi:hypothetical protein
MHPEADCTKYMPLKEVFATAKIWVEKTASSWNLIILVIFP